jgi:hypothetical protein
MNTRVSTVRRPTAAPARGFHAPQTGRSHRRPDGFVDELERGLHRLSRLAELPEGRALEVQLVVQVCNSESYPAFREARHKAWRREGGVFNTTAWPAHLDRAEYGVLLLPLAAGRPGLAVGRHPEPVADPVFGTGVPQRRAGFEELPLIAITRWVIDPGQKLPALLAPPVLEVVTRRGVLERRLLGWGLDWHLPTPDGL